MASGKPYQRRSRQMMKKHLCINPERKRGFKINVSGWRDGSVGEPELNVQELPKNADEYW